MILDSIARAEAALERYIGTTPNKGSYKLDAMRQFMASIGNPQNSYRVIHVAGTSGKTSTSYYAEAFCREAGLTTGLTVSPHVDSILERAQINGRNLPEPRFLELLGTFLDIVRASGIELSYFEVLVAFAYWTFAQEKVDVAVVEVGVGGLLDGTNVIDNPAKICVICDIGFDHVEILGSTLAAIAYQKAGIITPRNRVFMYRQADEITDVVTEVARRQTAELSFVTELPATGDVAELPGFQVRNLSLAYRAADYLATMLHLTIDEPVIQTVARETYIPGRMELFETATATVLLDGAHNAQKMTALVDAVSARYPDKVRVVLAVGQNKTTSLNDMMVQLARITDTLYVTSFGTNAGSYRQSMDVETVAAAARAHGIAVGRIDEDAGALLREVSADTTHTGPILITGSYYLFNDVRPSLLN